MAYTIHCPKCKKTVTCREQRRKSVVDRIVKWVISLFCPVCGLLLDSFEMSD